MTFILFEQLEGKEPIPASINPRFDVGYFGFEVDDIDAAVSKLRVKGVNILEEPINVSPGLRIAYFGAPDNVRIELKQRDK